VHGRDAPGEVCALGRARALRGRVPARVAGGLTRVVGRDTALAARPQLVARAGAGPGPRVAAVGAAGVGTSRLVSACVHAPHPRGWRVLARAAGSSGQATPSGPVVALRTRDVHGEEGDAPRPIRAQVPGQMCPLDASLQETMPAVWSRVDALPADRLCRARALPPRRPRTLDGRQRIVCRARQGPPLLVVCAALPWLDAEPQARRDSRSDSLPTARLRRRGTSRPASQHGGGRKTSSTPRRLAPLSPASAAAVRDPLRGQAPSLVPRTPLVMARPAGTPVCLAERGRPRVESGGLGGAPGAYRLAPALPTMQVPATVQAVRAARMDRRPPEAQRRLHTAAVLGTAVPWPRRQALGARPEAARHRGLAPLHAAECLEETRLVPAQADPVTQALTHAVADGRLLLARRRVLHAGMVEALEALGPAPAAEQVARLAPHARRGAGWAKALTSGRQAGEKTMARAASREAVGSCAQALGALPPLPAQRDTRAQAIDLRRALAAALHALGA
jgi:hypothetical protein